MHLLLVLRSSDHMPSVIAEVNKLLETHRSHSHNPHCDNHMLGVWRREDVDVGLPRMSCRDLVPLSDAFTPKENPGLGLEPAVPSLRIGESVSLCGVWALCSIYGFSSLGVTDESQRLTAVIEHLIGPYSMTEQGFFPVFPKSEPPETIKIAMHKFRDAYPNLVAGTWFIDDWNEGLIGSAVE